MTQIGIEWQKLQEQKRSNLANEEENIRWHGLSAATSRYVAELGSAATRYASDNSYASSMYATDANFKKGTYTGAIEAGEKYGGFWGGVVNGIGYLWDSLI